MKLSPRLVSVRSRLAVLLLVAAASCTAALVPIADAAQSDPDVSVTIVNQNIVVVVGHNFSAGETVSVDVNAGSDAQASATVETDGRFATSAFLPDSYSGTVTVTATAGSQTATGTVIATNTGTPAGMAPDPSPVPETPSSDVPPSSTGDVANGDTPVEPQASDTPPEPAPAAPPPHVDVINSAGPITDKAQAVADAVMAAVPSGITSIGGTRESAVDPNGHPSGRALDFMVGDNKDAGDAIVAYVRANWANLDIEYVIWQQAILNSPDGTFEPMEDRGSPTANHRDHVHVNVNP